jgi:hypothetical protein
MVMKKRPTRIVQFPAGQGLDRAMIASVLVPEAAKGGPSDAQGMVAAAAELADRTHRNIGQPNCRQCSSSDEPPLIYAPRPRFFHKGARFKPHV